MTLSLRSLAIAGLLACVPVAGCFAAQLDPADQVVAMRRGVNIIGYDPLWQDFAKARYHERHFQLIHEGGFQTVRVNLQAQQYIQITRAFTYGVNAEIGYGRGLGGRHVAGPLCRRRRGHGAGRPL